MLRDWGIVSMTDAYPSIEDHGLVGDLQAAALSYANHLGVFAEEIAAVNLDRGSGVVESVLSKGHGHRKT
jgi:hypothetical protein